mmetsp:Transcript_12413/g.27457  ORF Transcript_12413/g.27457 Transcript_12413/m.27457 type:complete len:89 (+) Transcript_12413:109-375(+)
MFGGLPSFLTTLLVLLSSVTMVQGSVEGETVMTRRISRRSKVSATPLKLISQEHHERAGLKIAATDGQIPVPTVAAHVAAKVEGVHGS